MFFYCSSVVFQTHFTILQALFLRKCNFEIIHTEFLLENISQVMI